MTHHTDAEQERASLGAFIDRAGRDGFDTAHTFFDCGGVVFFNPDTADLWGFWQAARRDPAVQPMPLEQAAASMRATQAQPARIIAASCSCVPAAVEGATYREKLDAELGRTAMRFVDRAGDVHPGIDDADQICREFHEAMSAVINQMAHVQMMRSAAPQPPEANPVELHQIKNAAPMQLPDALITLETDAHYIFNNPPGECPQSVRDVIEWYAASIRLLLSQHGIK